MPATAQEHSITCKYLSTQNITDEIRNMDDERIKNLLIEKLTADKRVYKLQFSKGKYLFSPDSNGDVEGLSVIGAGGSTYIDMNTDSIISQEAIIDKTFLVKDRLGKQDWNITGETKQIAGKACTKAVLNENGGITAWFTTEVPFNFGPAGYHGLPGLIVELVTPVYTYTLQEMSYSDNGIEIVPPSKGKVITKAEFKKLSEEKGAQLGKSRNSKITIIKM